MIHVSYGGSASQGFGGYSLGGDATTNLLKKLLTAVGVEKWEDLKGKHVRVQTENGRIRAMGHIMEDKWFDPSKDLK